MLLAPFLLALLPLLHQEPAPEHPWEPVPRLREYAWMSTADWNARHQAFLDRSKQADANILFLGDSITEGWGENVVWNERYAPRKAINLGIGGDTTQNVLWRISNGEIEGLHPRVVVLLIGTNNFGLHGDSPPDVARGVSAVVHELIRRLPDSRILLLAVFPRDQAPDTDSRKRIADLNVRISSLDDGRGVRFLDLAPSLTNPDGTLDPTVMPDFLHLSEEGYRRWSDSMEPLLAELLGP